MRNWKQFSFICILTTVFCFLLPAAAEAGETRALFAKEGYIEGEASISRGKVKIKGAEETKSVDVSDMIFLKFPARYIPKIVEEGVVLTNGNIISGDISVMEDRSVTIRSGVLGNKMISRNSVAKLILGPRKTYDISKGLSDAEGLLLRNGDSIPGEIKWITEAKVAIEGIIGLIEIPRENISVMSYRAADKAGKNGEYRIRFKNGDILSGTITSLDTQEVRFSHSIFGNLVLSKEYVKEIRRIRAHADDLSMIGESSVEKTPYFDTMRGIKKDRNYAGDYLSVGFESYDKGIIAMSRTVLAYNLKDRYSSFYAELGIDESVGDKGSVIFSIAADGKKVYESPSPVTGADPPAAVSVSIENVQTLKITVDFANGGNVADFAVIGDALLIKK